MTPTIAVLGGSSPFTVAMVEALADPAQDVPSVRLVLQGRSVEALELLEAYSQRRLGSSWSVSSTTDLDTAIEGATIVVHQIRYGGLNGRDDDERLAASFGCPPDETLGPAGLQAALRAGPFLSHLGERIKHLAPKAWVLNLTNPLSVATACLAEHVGEKCIGLCELPLQTVMLTCNELGVSLENASWAYTGLNHRGFVYHLRNSDVDLVGRLARLSDDITIGNIPIKVIRELGAVPTKYFRLMLGQYVLAKGRAAELETLRSQILNELAANLQAVPKSLSKRDMPWYEMSVVPVIASILNDDGRKHVANVLSDGIVRELPVSIVNKGWTETKQPPANQAVNDWVQRFERHERAVLAATLEPSEHRILEAVELDPLTPRGKERTIAEQLLRNILSTTKQ